MKYICEPRKVKQIRKAIKQIRMQKIDQMIENNEFLEQSYYNTEPTPDQPVNIIDRTVVVKEENILISGNPKQGLKLKIYNSHLKHTIDPKPSNRDEKVGDVPYEEKLHRSRMNEFIAHLDRRAKIVNKIKELRERK
jgi:hypothetical protein